MNIFQIVSIGSGWAESILKEQSNHYIDQLSDQYTALWTHLSHSQFKNMRGVLYDSWQSVVERGYLALLEGFAKIYECSTEGRALMSMDLATFSSNVNKHPSNSDQTGYIVSPNKKSVLQDPPLVKPVHGKEYVDMYIKIFYLPRDDVMQWIKQTT